jgi:hypothetical protein
MHIKFIPNAPGELDCKIYPLNQQELETLHKYLAKELAVMGGGGGGGGLPPGGGCEVGVCGRCTGTTGGFSLCLLGAVGLLDVGGVWVCGVWEVLDDKVSGGGCTHCFPLDIGGVGACCSGECGLEIPESELVCNCGVPDRLASLSVADVIASSTARSNSLTLVVSSSESLSLSVVGWSSSDA